MLEGNQSSAMIPLSIASHAPGLGCRGSCGLLLPHVASQTHGRVRSLRTQTHSVLPRSAWKTLGQIAVVSQSVSFFLSNTNSKFCEKEGGMGLWGEELGRSRMKPGG